MKVGERKLSFQDTWRQSCFLQCLLEVLDFRRVLENKGQPQPCSLKAHGAPSWAHTLPLHLASPQHSSPPGSHPGQAHFPHGSSAAAALTDKLSLANNTQL